MAYDPCLTCAFCKELKCEYFKLKKIMTRVSDIGQVKVGDILLLVEKDGKERSFISRVSSIPYVATDREEIVFCHENNYYFIMESYLSGNSWIKDAYVIKNALSPNQIKEGVFNN